MAWKFNTIIDISNAKGEYTQNHQEILQLDVPSKYYEELYKSNNPSENDKTILFNCQDKESKR